MLWGVITIKLWSIMSHRLWILVSALFISTAAASFILVWIVKTIWSGIIFFLELLTLASM